jgi:hypothetical protein
MNVTGPCQILGGLAWLANAAGCIRSGYFSVRARTEQPPIRNRDGEAAPVPKDKAGNPRKQCGNRREIERSDIRSLIWMS